MRPFCVRFFHLLIIADLVAVHLMPAVHRSHSSAVVVPFTQTALSAAPLWFRRLRVMANAHVQGGPPKTRRRLADEAFVETQKQSAALTEALAALFTPIFSRYETPPAADVLQKDFHAIRKPVFALFRQLRIQAQREIVLSQTVEDYLLFNWFRDPQSGLCWMVVEALRQAAQRAGRAGTPRAVREDHEYFVWGDLAIDLTIGQFLRAYARRFLVVPMDTYKASIEPQIPHVSDHTIERYYEWMSERFEREYNRILHAAEKADRRRGRWRWVSA